VKFSVVTPSYNQGRFIRDCLESVRTQTGVEVEHIVVDAGSTDGTLEILKSAPQIQWTSEPDAGMSDGINKGFRRATGEWLMWLNTDDYLLPGALARVDAFAEAHPDADVIYGDCLFVDEERRVLRSKREHRFDFNTLLFYGCFIPSTSTFIHRRVIATGQLLDVGCRVCMDFEYYLRLSRAGCRFAHLPEALACFRWHAANTSSVQHARRRAERLQIQRQCLRAMNRLWLGHPVLLDILYRVYQVKRGWLRLLSTFSKR